MFSTFTTEAQHFTCLKVQLISPWLPFCCHPLTLNSTVTAISNTCSRTSKLRILPTEYSLFVCFTLLTFLWNVDYLSTSIHDIISRSINYSLYFRRLSKWFAPSIEVLGRGALSFIFQQHVYPSSHSAAQRAKDEQHSQRWWITKF
jgi:hypothetical protein